MSGTGSRATVGSRVSIKRIGMVLGPILLFIVYMTVHSNFLLARALMLAFPDVESTYRGAWPTFTGSIIASDVVVMPFEDPDDALRFERVRVEIPFLQWLRSAFYKKENVISPISEVRLVFDGAQTEGAVGFTFQTQVFGDASASPFEAEGCAEDGLWLRDELKEMGLKPEPTRLIMGYRAEPGRLVKEQALITPGASKVNATRIMNMSGESSLLGLEEPDELSLASDHWTIEDEGFVAARNRHCGRRDSVDPALVGARHIAVLQRIFASDGLQVGAQATELYRRFSQRGGRLDLDVEYSPNLNEVYDDSFGEWVPYVRGSLSLDGERVDLGLTRIAARPFPQTPDETDTVFALMQREGSLTPALLGLPADATTTITGTAMPGATSTVAIAPAPAATAVTPAVAATSPPPATAPTSITSTAATSPAAAAKPAPGTRLRYRDLLRLVGSRVRVYSHGREARVVEIAAVSGGVVKVRHRVGGGWASYDLQASSFGHAELLP